MSRTNSRRVLARQVIGEKSQESAQRRFNNKMMSEDYVYIVLCTKWVNPGFYAGADFPDPEGLRQGTGAKLRHVKVRDVAAADTPAIRALIKAAYDKRRQEWVTHSCLDV